MLILLAKGIFRLAIHTSNMYSAKHIYQDKEPESLKKYLFSGLLLMISVTSVSAVNYN